MNPLLSIIIPVYNHKEHLPALLANLAEQQCSNFEVILMDDCSDEPCDDVVSAWQNKGFDLVLYKNSSRQYTKNTRLNGIEHARGELIMFIDADDLLAGTAALGDHVALMREKDVDLLQFQIASYLEGKISRRAFAWTKPLGESLSGPRIFEAYVAEELRGHLVCGKIAKRSLWQKCLAPARASSVRRYREDLLLASLLYFHAESYCGSDRIGYSYITKDKTSEKAIGRAASSYAMLMEFLPYIKQQGVSAPIAEHVEHFLLHEVQANIAFAEDRIIPRYGYAIPDAVLREIEEHCPLETFLKIMLAGFPLQHIQKLEADNETLLQAVRNSAKILAAKSA